MNENQKLIEYLKNNNLLNYYYYDDAYIDIDVKLINDKSSYYYYLFSCFNWINNKKENIYEIKKYNIDKINYITYFTNKSNLHFYINLNKILADYYYLNNKINKYNFYIKKTTNGIKIYCFKNYLQNSILNSNYAYQYIKKFYLILILILY